LPQLHFFDTKGGELLLRGWDRPASARVGDTVQVHLPTGLPARARVLATCVPDHALVEFEAEALKAELQRIPAPRHVVHRLVRPHSSSRRNLLTPARPRRCSYRGPTRSGC